MGLPAKEKTQRVLQPHAVLAKNLQSLLEKSGLTEAAVSRLTGIAQPTMHKLLTGKTEDPRISTLQCVSDFFEVSIDDLYSEAPILNKKNRLAAQSIPIISWSNCLKSSRYLSTLNPANWQDWVVLEPQGKDVYGLKTKPSMEPKFLTGSVLVINPHTAPRDGDFVVAHYPNTTEATLRQILLDGPKRQLCSVVENKNCEELTSEVALLGVVVQTRYVSNKEI